MSLRRFSQSHVDHNDVPTLSALLGEAEVFQEIHAIMIPHIGRVPVLKGDIHLLPKNVQKFIIHWVRSDFVYLKEIKQSIYIFQYR